MPQLQRCCNDSSGGQDQHYRRGRAAFIAHCDQTKTLGFSLCSATAPNKIGLACAAVIRQGSACASMRQSAPTSAICSGVLPSALGFQGVAGIGDEVLEALAHEHLQQGAGPGRLISAMCLALQRLSLTARPPRQPEPPRAGCLARARTDVVQKWVHKQYSSRQRLPLGQVPGWQGRRVHGGWLGVQAGLRSNRS